MFSQEFPATIEKTKQNWHAAAHSNKSFRTEPEVLNSVNRNASNEISQSTYMIKPEACHVASQAKSLGSHGVVRIFCPVVYYLVLGVFKNVTLKLKEQLQITSALHYRTAKAHD